MARPTFGINLFVQDIDKNLEYFTQTLGFQEVERQVAPDGSVVHATVAWGKGAKAANVSLASIPLMTGGDGPDYDFGQFGQNLRNSPGTLGNGVVLFFHVPNVDKVYARINAKGAIIDEPPTDQFWGERTISVNTPDGYYLTFAQPIKGWKDDGESGMTTVKAGKKGAKAKGKAGKKKR
jgi:catechol 2,3-dioxygenase-like lactoylglutathione lyase family enzyme